MFWKNKEKQQKQQKQKTDQISINRLNIRSLLIRDLIKLLKIRSVKRLTSPRIQDLNWNCIRRIIVSTTRRRRDIKIALCLSAPAEKFNVVSNDHGRTHKCDFSVSDRKYPFCANLVKKKKIQIVSLNWNLVPSLIRICRVQWRCSFFSVSDRKHPFGQTWSEKSELSV